MKKPATYDEVIKTIAENYKEIEQSIANQLLLNVSGHYPTEGAYRETVWKSLFEMIIPRKYCIEQGVFIIDSYGNKSNEVDLAIFDELYTPYIFNYGKIKFIPIEAVAAVVQCKSREIKRKQIEDWQKSVERLTTSMDSVARFAISFVDNSVKHEAGTKGNSTQTATRPIKILCALAEKNDLLKWKEQFDIILSVDIPNSRLFKIMKDEEENLVYWNNSLNHSFEKIKDTQVRAQRSNKKKELRENETNRTNLLKELKIEQKNSKGEDGENVILSLIFQLNQLLMVINNPMLFPHRAYAERFHKILNEEFQEKGDERADEDRG